mmetsp:Transcript_27670/g.33651  ORF Transcript_27670/g.33651 Transcript_27670/m.33651 type:complete len:273 (-) Transcript_27670:46-864(-)|eukprot:CAMPEP_0172502216 /NCGR_PEP_ID=MMETSP1066-20121228/157899_1 /TAXON_ID=671091 /ORGANISM="Coscinodiscus wailesii, Strain CCMP2513" /LENGTH=272 /DNA_ID=CAMNT_0013277399 /DNA_START=52 /DNA_END=870 /DNA_ORIENTATION=-
MLVSTAIHESSSSNTESDLIPLLAKGRCYRIQIHTRTLGVVLFPPDKLIHSLLSQAPLSYIECLQSRPVISYLIENSPAKSAGIELGHVLLRINDRDTNTIDEALQLLVTTPRPLYLELYELPKEVEVVVGEGVHAVNYDGKGGLNAPPMSSGDWKKKYVVIGGVISKAGVMSFYRSKAEYDIAVIETQSNRPVSVKVKMFSLRGAIIKDDWKGPQLVTYPDKSFPWKYIVVILKSGLPVKISSPQLAELKVVHEAIRRVLSDLKEVTAINA